MSLEINSVILGRWKLRRKLGFGAFGTVFEAVDIDDKSRKAAIKTGTVEDGAIEHEHSVYQAIHTPNRLYGVPRVLGFGTEGSQHFLVMSMLGDSIGSLFRQCRYVFSDFTVLQIGIQMLDLLESIHNRGIIHRDLKPDNVMVGRHSDERTMLYLVDFNLGKQYKSHGYHIPREENIGFRGTRSFASRHAHRGESLSRRDDLESLCYMLVYLYKGSLPWDNIPRGDADRSAKTGKMKDNYKSRALWANVPDVYYRFMTRVVKLGFFERPNYDKFRNSLKTELRHVLKRQRGEPHVSWMRRNPRVRRKSMGI